MGSRRRSLVNLRNQASLLNQAPRPLESVPPREEFVDARKRHPKARLAHWLLLGLMMMQASFRVGGQMMALPSAVDDERERIEQEHKLAEEKKLAEENRLAGEKRLAEEETERLEKEKIRVLQEQEE